MNKEQVIEKWQEKLSEIEDAIKESWNAQMDEHHQLRQNQKIILEFINDVKKLDLSDVVKSVCCFLDKDNLCTLYHDCPFNDIICPPKQTVL